MCRAPATESTSGGCQHRCACVSAYAGAGGLYSKILVKGGSQGRGGEFPFPLCSWAMWPGWVWAGSFHFPKCNNTPGSGVGAGLKGGAVPTLGRQVSG